MKTVISFRACDGTTFRSKTKCEDYEKRLFTIRLRICDIEFWDENRKNMVHPLMTDEKYNEKIDELYAKSTYLHIVKDIPEFISAYILTEWGWLVPYERGIYKYNWSENKWIREI